MSDNPLLLLHGALGAASQVSPLIGFLPPTRNCWTVDLPGHGFTELGEETFDIAGFAHSMIQRMDLFKIEQVDVFGYSMGGYVALYLARHFPHRIGKIITLATKFEWTPESAEKETGKLNPEVIEEKVPAFAQLLDARHKAGNWKELLSKTAAMMIEMGNKNPLEESDFKAIQHTVWLHVGEQDNMVSQEETKAVSELLPNGHFIALPDTKHPFDQIDLQSLAQTLESLLGTAE